MNTIITLLTDFGTQDGYIGTMRGVILGINPQAQIVDISHEIAPQDIHQAAFVLRNAYPFFPPGTIHVVVVDPGVGGQRRIIAVRTNRYYFLAPDNGVLKYVFHQEKDFEVVEITNRDYFLDEISYTFHGRDIFAPVAAHLSLGVDITRLGKTIDDFIQGEVTQAEVGDGKIIGRVIYIDRFGNLITDVPREMVERLPESKFQITAGTYKITKLCRSYLEGSSSEPSGVIDSSGFLAIFLNQGNAAELTGLKIGDRVFIETFK